MVSADKINGVVLINLRFVFVLLSSCLHLSAVILNEILTKSFH